MIAASKPAEKEAAGISGVRISQVAMDRTMPKIPFSIGLFTADVAKRMPGVFSSASATWLIPIDKDPRAEVT